MKKPKLSGWITERHIKYMIHALLKVSPMAAKEINRQVEMFMPKGEWSYGVESDEFVSNARLTVEIVIKLQPL